MGVHKSRQLSLVTGLGLPEWSAGPTEPDAVIGAAADAGYEGMQVFVPDQAAEVRATTMTHASAIAPARSIAEVDFIFGMWANGGAESISLHLGTGFETADQAKELVEATLKAAETHGVAALVETHRATLFQDPARALVLVEEFPELTFTADLSHWYTGIEMVYGDIDAKFEAITPVLDRCRMIHGRISDPGCIQVAVSDGETSDHVEHFRRMWTMVLDGCERAGVDTLPFMVELLPAASHYARTIDRGNGPEEEVDRWTQADVLWRIFESLEATS